MKRKKAMYCVALFLGFLLIYGMPGSGLQAAEKPAQTGQPLQPIKMAKPVAQLPDLVVEHIALDNNCNVVVRVKNNGPGSIPDEVWTVHTPESPGVYLTINGKKWGGETIWKFDPGKALQAPGGAATYTSTLKVTGTTVIRAYVDHTRKITEADERNNVKAEKLTCKVQPAGPVVQPGQQTGPGRVKVVLSVKPSKYMGKCPALLHFSGKIAYNQAGDVKYQFIRSDNATAPIETISFTGPGTKEVSTTWQLGGAELPKYSGWQAIKILSPVEMESNKAQFEVRCAGPGQPGERPGRPGDRPGEQPTGSVSVKEDCVSFNPATTTVSNVQGRWKIVDGSHWMFDFAEKKTESLTALNIIKYYKMNQSCFVGRPDPSFQYMLISGAPPSGSMNGEDCVSFNPATTTVSNVQGRWKIVDGSHWMFDFGNNEAEARQSLAIIKKYGFTKSCFVGRPDPSFKYLRK